MKVWVMPSPIAGVKECLLIPEDKPLGGLPAKVQAKFKNAEVWKTIDLEPGDNRIALDSRKALEAIQKNGYYIAGSQILFEEKE